MSARRSFLDDFPEGLLKKTLVPLAAGPKSDEKMNFKSVKLIVNSR